MNLGKIRSLCTHSGDQNPTAERLRRTAAAAAASAAALTGLPALTFPHGHPIIGAACIAVQACLLTVAFGLVARIKRIQIS